MKTESLVRLNGSYGEGGGQILRSALFLSLLAQRPLHIDQIRQNRPKPGLKPQHEGILHLLCQMTQSEAKDVHVGATEIQFLPGRFREGSYAYDMGTAGSIPLFLQTLLPVMLATPGRTELVLTGGTDVTFGPTIEWVRRAYAPLLAPLATKLRIDVDRRGFYPKGGGRVHVVTESALKEPGLDAFRVLVRRALRAERLSWTQPAHLELVSIAHVQLQGRRVAERQLAAAEKELAQAGHTAVGEVAYVDALCPGSSLTVVATDAAGNRLGADGLGAPGVLAETVGERVGTKFLVDLESGATVDQHLADHLVPWVALGAGPLRVPRPTGHLLTNIWVCGQFLGEQAVTLTDLVLKPAAT